MVAFALAFSVTGLMVLTAWMLLSQPQQSNVPTTPRNGGTRDSSPEPVTQTYTRKRAIHLPDPRRFYVSYHICRRSQLELRKSELFPAANLVQRKADDPLRHFEGGTVDLEDDEFLVVKTYDWEMIGTRDGHLHQLGQEIPEAEGLILCSSPYLTRNGLMNLHSWRNLRYLELSGPLSQERGVEDNDFELLGGIGSLTHLCFSYFHINATYRVPKKGMLALAGLTRLESLYCPHATTDAEVAVAFASLNELRVLHLHPMRDPDAWFETFAKLPRLERLTCYGMWLRDAHIARLAGLSNLRYVMLGHCTLLTDASLVSLARCSKLEGIDLFGGLNTNITIQGIALLSRLPLTELRLGGTFLSLSDGILGVLAGMKRLRILRLPYMPAFTGRGLGLMAKLPHLEKLNLGLCSHMNQHELRALVNVDRPLEVSVPRHVWGSLREELATANPNLTFNR